MGPLMGPQMLGVIGMLAKPKIQEFLANMNKKPEENQEDRLLREAFAHAQMQQAREKVEQERKPEMENLQRFSPLNIRHLLENESIPEMNEEESIAEYLPEDIPTGN